MAVTIHTIPLGFTHCYLLQDQGTILIDGGAPKRGRDFSKGLEKLGVKPDEIRIMILTHGHWDHIGSAREIQDLTGALIAMHRLESDWLESSRILLPPGITPWGKVFKGIMTLFKPMIQVPRAKVDLAIGEEGLSMAGYGIPGRVLHTPGHSPGSVSILLEGGEAFVGDLAMNRFPLCLGPRLPIFAEDGSLVRKSWKLLLDQGAKTIYPAHGKPFPAEVIRKALGSTVDSREG